MSSEQEVRSEVLSAELSSAGIIPKYGKKEFRKIVSKARHNFVAYAKLAEVIYSQLGKNDRITFPANYSFKYAKTKFKDLSEALQQNVIRDNGNGTVALNQDLEIDQHIIKQFRKYIELNFDLIDKVHSMSTKRSAGSISGVYLTTEGFAFVNGAFYEGDDVVTGDDLTKYAVGAGVKEEQIPRFIEVYNRFREALDLSMIPEYGNEDVNAFMKNVVSLNLIGQLLYLYKKLKFGQGNRGRFTPNQLLLSLTTAYDNAVNKSRENRRKLIELFGEANWNRVEQLLYEYVDPQLTSLEEDEVAKARNKTAKKNKKEAYIKEKKARIVAQIKQLNPNITDNDVLKASKSLMSETTGEVLTNQSLTIMKFALADYKNKNPAFDRSPDSVVNKERKEKLENALEANLPYFTDYTIPNSATQIRNLAYSFIQEGDYATAAKIVNKYISDSIKLMETFVKNNQAVEKKHRVQKVTEASITSFV